MLYIFLISSIMKTGVVKWTQGRRQLWFVMSYQEPGGARPLVDSSNQRPQHYPVWRGGHGAVHGQPRSFGTRPGTAEETGLAPPQPGKAAQASPKKGARSVASITRQQSSWSSMMTHILPSAIFPRMAQEGITWPTLPQDWLVLVTSLSYETKYGASSIDCIEGAVL